MANVYRWEYGKIAVDGDFMYIDRGVGYETFEKNENGFFSKTGGAWQWQRWAALLAVVRAADANAVEFVRAVSPRGRGKIVPKGTLFTVEVGDTGQYESFVPA